MACVSHPPRHAVAWLLPFILIGWLATPLLSGRNELAFRDGASHYSPQYHFLRRVWREGRFPLWNRWENGGIDMSADPTYGLFYPGKLLLLVPGDWPIPYHVFLFGHLLLAYVGTYRGLRRQRRSSEAAAIAAASFTLGGHLLSQLHNAIYLVSAAWLPIAWFALERWLIRGDRSSLALAAIGIAMMVLGGDPQTAFHVMLIAGCYCITRLWNGVSRTLAIQRLAMAMLLAMALSAAQWVPSSLAARESYRALYVQPRSIWQELAALTRSDSPMEIPAEETPSRAAGVNREWLRASHDRQIGAFSIAPWRWCEMVWPNVGGRFFPRYSRWFDAIPAEGRCWSLSLYAGLIPFLAATTMFRWRSGNLAKRRASWMILIAVAASLGHVGLYWLFIKLIPGYDLFRYPGKWWTLASLACASLAAAGIDAAMHAPRQLLRRAVGVLALTLFTVTMAGLLSTRLVQWWRTAATDDFFGPLDFDAAFHDLLAALGHTAVVSIALILVIRSASRHRATYLLCLTLVELAVANGWIVVVTPCTHSVARPAEKDPAEKTPIKKLIRRWRGRIYRPGNRLFRPPFNEDLTSLERLKLQLQLDRETLYGKHFLDTASFNPLDSRQQSFAALRDINRRSRVGGFEGVIGPESAVMPADIWLAVGESLQQRSSLKRTRQSGNSSTLALTLLKLQQVRGVIESIPSSSTPQHNGNGHAIVPLADHAQLRRLPVPYVPCFHMPLRNIIADPRPNSQRLADHVAWIKRQFSRRPKWRVDCAPHRWSNIVAAATSPMIHDHQVERCNAMWDTRQSDRLILHSSSTSANIVVLPHRFSQGWKAICRKGHRRGDHRRSLPVLRIQGLVMGVVVPAGSHDIELVYRPWPNYLAILGSALAWAGLAFARLGFTQRTIRLLVQLLRLRRSKR